MTTQAQTIKSNIERFSQWDEGGVYLAWPAIEELRESLLDYIVLLTSDPEHAVYDNRTLNKIRLQLLALGGKNG